MTASQGSASLAQGTYHAAHLREDPARAVLWNVLADHLSPYIPTHGTVLELGAGYCYWINRMRAAHKIAVDIWRDLPRYTAPDVQGIVHDLTYGLSVLGKQTFDVVVASNLLEHFEPDVVSMLIAEVWEHLRMNGCLILIQPNFRYAYRRYFDDYTHRSIFTDVSLPNLLRAHRFNIERIEPKFLPYSLQGKGRVVIPWLIRVYLQSPFKPLAGQMLVVGRKRTPTTNRFREQ